MRERPILLSGPMVRAILEGRKTQTRRVVKPVRGYEHNDICRPDMAADPGAVWWHGASERVGCLQPCPFGVPGDQLVVVELRETRIVDVLAGSDGHAYSTRQSRRNARSELPRRLSESPASGGYPIISVSRGVGRKTWALHTLVCEAFHGLRPGRTSVVRHLDGDPANNDPANLRWGTKAENEADKRRHKTLACGSKQGSAKLTEEAVDLIRRAVPIGLLTAERAAEFYGVVPSTIRQIVRGGSWRGFGDAEEAPSPAYEHVRLVIKGVSVQRLQDITEEDARAEGVAPSPFTRAGLAPDLVHFDAFQDLWSSIYGAKSWDANPWTWCISFERVSP